MSTVLENFNVEQQFITYLNRVELKLDEMHPQQILETRRAFYGAWGQLLVLFSNELGSLTPEVGNDMVIAMFKQVQDFWDKSV